MGFFGKKPDKNVPVLSREEVTQKILGLNRDSAPYRIIDGKAEGVDLIAEWKIVDAKWKGNSITIPGIALFNLGMSSLNCFSRSYIGWY